MSEAHDKHRVWARAVTWVGIVALVLGAGLYVFKSLRDLPGDAVEGTKEVLDGARRVAQAFFEGTATTYFFSHATEVTGGTHLQFATLKQVEVFERREEASALWGLLELPAVVVRATAPVEYTYVLDLDDEWNLTYDGDRLVVDAPEITYNTPSVDVSAIRYEVKEGAFFQDSAPAMDRLRSGITAMAQKRAKENVPLVREVGRERTEDFVRNWLAASFSDGEDVEVVVRFPDETAGEKPLRRRTSPVTVQRPEMGAPPPD